MCNCLKNRKGTVVLDRSTQLMDISDLLKLYKKMTPVRIDEISKCIEVEGYSTDFSQSNSFLENKYTFDFNTQTFNKI